MKLAALVLCFVMLMSLGLSFTTAQPEQITFRELWRIEGIRAGAWSPTGDRIAVAGTEQGLSLYEADTGKLLRRLSEAIVEDYPPQFQLGWSPDGHYLSGRLKGLDKAQVWDTLSGKPLYTIPWRGSPLAFSPDGTLLAGLTEHGQVLLWDALSGETRETLRSPTRDFVNALVFAWTPDGHSILFGESDGVDLSLFDLATKTPRLRFSMGDGSLYQGGWTPDSLYIFGVSRAKTLHRWNTFDGAPVDLFFLGGDTVSFSPDGQYFAANYHSFPYDDNHPPWNVVYIYSARTLERVGQIDYPESIIYVRWLAWSPDGSHLATVTMEPDRPGILQVWQRVTP